MTNTPNTKYSNTFKVPNCPDRHPNVQLLRWFLNHYTSDNAAPPVFWPRRGYGSANGRPRKNSELKWMRQCNWSELIGAPLFWATLDDVAIGWEQRGGDIYWPSLTNNTGSSLFSIGFAHVSEVRAAVGPNNFLRTDKNERETTPLIFSISPPLFRSFSTSYIYPLQDHLKKK